MGCSKGSHEFAEPQWPTATRKGAPLAALALLAITVATSPVCAADVEYQALFDRLDSNHDGRLASDEIPPEKDRLFKRLLRAADADRDGRLSPQEFLTALSEPAIDRAKDGERANESERAKESPESQNRGFLAMNPEMVFRRLDANGDGRVTSDEFPDERRENVSRLIERADANGDGAMTREEFDKVRELIRGQQPATASGPDLTRIWQRLLAADKDSDGRLSAEEAPERMQRNFERLDTNKDGFVEEAEFKSSVARMRAALGKKDS